MPLDLWLAFLGAAALLMLMPGPNVAVIVANAVAYGTRYGLLTVAGTSAAMLLQLAAVTAGLAALLGGLAPWFEMLRWLGVAWLVWLGIRQWRAPPADLAAVAPSPRLPRRMAARGFLVSLANPKTLLFYGAFLPQFVRPQGDLPAQLLLLAATALACAVAIDCGWALLAGRARPLLAGRGRLRNRLSGGLLLGAGLGLALVRRG